MWPDNETTLDQINVEHRHHRGGDLLPITVGGLGGLGLCHRKRIRSTSRGPGTMPAGLTHVPEDGCDRRGERP